MFGVSSSFHHLLVCVPLHGVEPSPLRKDDEPPRPRVGLEVSDPRIEHPLVVLPIPLNKYKLTAGKDGLDVRTVRVNNQCSAERKGSGAQG